MCGCMCGTYVHYLDCRIYLNELQIVLLLPKYVND